MPLHAYGVEQYNFIVHVPIYIYNIHTHKRGLKYNNNIYNIITSAKRCEQWWRYYSPDVSWA